MNPQFFLMILPLVLAITVHEAAHGYAARYCGDHTAERAGRLTLNPIAHIDLIGTIIVPTVIFLTTSMAGGSGFIFGWAKPVPINPNAFRNARLGLRLTSIAGPMANFIMMILWAVMVYFSQLSFIPQAYQTPLATMGTYGVLFNLFLGALNMLPILPMDGGRFVDSFLSARHSQTFQKIEPYGMWIVLFLLISGVLSWLFNPLFKAAFLLIYGIAAGFDFLAHLLGLL